MCKKYTPFCLSPWLGMITLTCVLNAASLISLTCLTWCPGYKCPSLSPCPALFIAADWCCLTHVVWHLLDVDTYCRLVFYWAYVTDACANPARLLSCPGRWVLFVPFFTLLFRMFPLIWNDNSYTLFFTAIKTWE